MRFTAAVVVAVAAAVTLVMSSSTMSADSNGSPRVTETSWRFVRDWSLRHKVPVYVTGSIVMAESGGNPAAISTEADGSQSIGLLQLNTNGQGAGYSTSYLLDPTHNFQIGGPPIRSAYRGHCAGQSGYGLASCVASWSGHNAENGGSVDADLPQSYQAFVSGQRPRFLVSVVDPLALRFRTRVWSRYTTNHALPSIPYEHGGLLTWPAQTFVHRWREMGGVVSRPTFHGKPHHDGYIQQKFQGVTWYGWPHHRSWGVKLVQHPWVS